MKAHDKTQAIDPKDILPVLAEMDKGTRIVITEAPPGAGKTFLTAFCVANAIDRGESVIVVTNSYEQAYGVCSRLHALFPKITPVIYANKRRRTNDSARGFADGFSFACDFKDLDTAVKTNRPIVTVMRKLTVNQLKPSNSGDMLEISFRWMLVDEAWQMADADFAIIAPLAQGFVLVGDRGQIPPIVRSDVTRWKSEKSGPQRPAPEALLARPHLKGMLVERPMSVSRRLPQRSAEIVQRIFYPRLKFTGSSAPRRLIVDPMNSESLDPSSALQSACNANPPGFIPVRVPGAGRRNATDLRALDAMGALAIDLLDGGVTIDSERPLEPSDVVLLVSRNQERRYLSVLLRDRPGLTIATANKFQGAERPVSIILHPLSGKTETSEFDSDSGRLCVMLSRHTHACFVVHRDGIEEMLEANVPNAPRALGDAIDAPFSGWRANLEFLRWVRVSGATVTAA